MEESLDIIDFIENNPITTFNIETENQSQLATRLASQFTNQEEKLFLTSFYCYLNYDTKKDFVINLDNIWQWLGFQRKRKCK